MYLQVLREIKVKNFDSSLYKTSQIFYRSKDGTKIPMFIVMKHVGIFRIISCICIKRNIVKNF